MTNNHGGRNGHSFNRRFAAPMVALLAVPQALFAGGVAVNGLWPQCEQLGILSWTKWFDPTFFAYNLVLVAFAVLAVPGIVFFYVTTMKQEKLRRLSNELNEGYWRANEAIVNRYVSERFRMRKYSGSLATLTLIVLLGASIILLLKPVPRQGPMYGCGVDYSLGANMLMLGPYLESFVKAPDEFYHHVIISLTAFQFGFLGAYVYLISDMVRGYFTLDLSPRTLVASTIRIMTASLLALVLSFAIAPRDSDIDSFLPGIAFIAGYFPESALLYLKSAVTKVLRVKKDPSREIMLSLLPGMSYAHQTRLVREGYDNVQNLANARPLDLVLTTGFSYRQSRQWIAQAWLCTHLGAEHYHDFCRCTGLMGADELAQFISVAPRGHDADAEKLLVEATKSQYAHKIAVVCALVGAWRERTDQALIA